MAHFLVEHPFPDGFHVQAGPAGDAVLAQFRRTFARHGVVWQGTIVSADRTRGWSRFCASLVRDVLAACEDNDLQVLSIVGVEVVEPAPRRIPGLKAGAGGADGLGMTMDSERLLDSVELIAASAWATEAVLRALERGEVHDAAALLADARRPLRQGLRELRRLLDDELTAGPHRGDEDVAVRTLEGVARLEELIARRVA